MWIHSADRSDLIEILQAGHCGAAVHVRSTDDLGAHTSDPNEIVIVWKRDPADEFLLPSVIVVAAGKIQDFLAWTMTYLPELRPLTAYCRVASLESLRLEFQTSDPAKFAPFQSASLGLILGEASTYLASRPRGALNTNACSSTCSYILARALARGVLDDLIFGLSDSWSLLREITNQRPLPLNARDIGEVWTTVVALAGDKPSVKKHPDCGANPLIVDACVELSATQQIPFRQLGKLAGTAIDMNKIALAAGGPREQRVVELERILDKLSRSRRRNRTSLSFVGGCLASLVSPGTFDHGAILERHTSRLPAILMWYGLCAGLYKDSRLRQFSAGLGYKIMREVLREEDIFDTPHCDISLSELEVLVAGNPAVRGKLISSSAGYIEVELLPCISSLIRWPNYSDQNIGSSNRSRQEELFPDVVKLDSDLERLLSELRSTVKRVGSIERRLQEKLGKKPVNDGRRRD